MKLSNLQEDRIKVGLNVISAKGRRGMIYEIDKEDVEGWMIWIKWWDKETMSYKEKDISGVRPYQGDKITVDIPECCYTCSYEDSGCCEWLGVKIGESKSLFCPPGECPLRVEDWPEATETNFEEMAKEDPAKLARWIKSEVLSPGTLTFAAETLGKSSLNFTEKEKALLPLLKHPKAIVREGAVYGFGYMEECDRIKEILEKVAKSDFSPGVKGAAKDMLEDYEEN